MTIPHWIHIVSTRQSPCRRGRRPKKKNPEVVEFIIVKAIFDLLRSSITRYNASYCKAVCSDKESKLPTIDDFKTTKYEIEYFSSPGESIRKPIQQVRNGFYEYFDARRR